LSPEWKNSPLPPPGERVQYSNMAFEILCDVVAKASGASFDEYGLISVGAFTSLMTGLWSGSGVRGTVQIGT